MKLSAGASIRTRLTLWYVSVLAILLIVYAATVFAFQYATLTSQIFHDEVQDVETVEGLLYFDAHGILQLRQDYYSRPQSHLLIDRLMEVRDLGGNVLYRSSTLRGSALGGPVVPREGDDSFNEHILRLSDGRHVFVISHIHGMGNRTVIIRLGYSLQPLRQRMVPFLILLLVALPVALALAALAGQTIAGRALRPLHEMAERAQAIGVANLHERLNIANPSDELGRLAAVFNHLLQRLEQAFEQLQRFTADAAHELRTPLASLRATGEVAMQSEQSSKKYQDALSSILEETDRLGETIDSLLLLATVEAAGLNRVLEAVPVVPLVTEVLGVLSVLIEEKRIHVLWDGQHLSQAIVAADRSLLRVAILNVIHNAIKFSPQGGELKVSVVELEARCDVIRIVVADQGPGLESGEFERVFERFYRGSTTSAGAGVGLSVAKLITERLGGRIWFDRSVRLGASCVIELPGTRV